MNYDMLNFHVVQIRTENHHHAWCGTYTACVPAECRPIGFALYVSVAFGPAPVSACRGSSLLPHGTMSCTTTRACIRNGRPGSI